MGKPNRKLKKIIKILGITGAVYGIFRYLLPLVVPFFVAWGLAEALEPSAKWLSAKCRITVRGKRFGLSVGAAGVLEFLLFLAVLGTGLWAGSSRFMAELGMAAEQFPLWVRKTDVWLTNICVGIEERFGLKTGILTILAQDMLKGMVRNATDRAVLSLMTNSVPICRMGIQTAVVSAMTVIALGLTLQEMDVWKKCMRRSDYREEFQVIGRRLSLLFGVWFKTQILIMMITAVVCMGGFALMKNPYYILLGTGIGVLDAFPVFGTGTVLIPWAVIALIRGKMLKAGILLGMYLSCYFIREYMEARFMGGRLGLTPLEMLISMYAGLQLFGIAGFLLGPLGVLLVRDLTSFWESREEDEV